MECHKLTDGENGIDCNRVDELGIKQEEADTLMLLHAGHASPNGQFQRYSRYIFSVILISSGHNKISC